MKNKQEPMVLVGLGRHDLADLMEKVNEASTQKFLLEAFDKHHLPPRYRRHTICSEKEIDAFATYLNWILKEIK